MKHNALRGIQFRDCGEYAFLLLSNSFNCARHTGEQSVFSSSIRPHDIPGAAAQPVHPHLAYIAQRES